MTIHAEDGAPIDVSVATRSVTDRGQLDHRGAEASRAIQTASLAQYSAPRRPRWSRKTCAPLVLALLAACGEISEVPVELDAVDSLTPTLGATYQVGPGRAYSKLQDVAGRLNPGDIVEVYGQSAAYPGGVLFTQAGAASAPITIRGVREGGRRPIITGGVNTVEFRANHYVFESFEVTGGTSRVLYHHAHNITVRDTLIRDCPAHGLLGADTDSGSLTLEYSEIYNCGAGDRQHPVYMSTDQRAYPGAVFRMQHCYMHDGKGGNNVKSRAQRNEIYYNWIEGGFYRELELIGPEDTGVAGVREDSDVVGNVMVKTQGSNIARIGGDGGGGDTSGRYRFVNNTIILKADSPAAIQVFDRVESLEMHDNVFYRLGGGGVQVVRDTDAVWTSGSAKISGQNNWLPTGSLAPAGFSDSRGGSGPGFVDVTRYDLRLASTSPLINSGANITAAPAGYPFPSPLAATLLLPPRRAALPPGKAEGRPQDRARDIGAFEYGAAVPPPPTCQTGGAWASQSFTAQTGTFTLEADLTPTAASLDAGFAVAKGPQGTWNGLAGIVLFDVSGQITARKGDVYTASTAVRYTAGVTYHTRLLVNVPSHSYSVYITPPGKPEVALAQSFAFRTQQAGVTALSQSVLAGTGALKACNVTLR